jgi:hypothetical protein
MGLFMDEAGVWSFDDLLGLVGVSGLRSTASRHYAEIKSEKQRYILKNAEKSSIGRK